ncbi:hypothetical protein FSP39_005364 [Pinctada imbricata]|uniref:Uncharacterized protein n=1 Tax=Pinctada imbricata TaxID=66713 RepID=A0AA88XZ61_PINIB|nr:hypothetical protein FSP39_005364 [Pinctada imbricata]
MEKQSKEKKLRIAKIFKCMVKDDEDEIIWTLSSNIDLAKEEFGFEMKQSGNKCICGHMFEKLRHNDHVFHINKLSDWIVAGHCPHAEKESNHLKQEARSTFLHCACALGKLRVVKFLAHEHDVSLELTTKAVLFSPIHFAIYNRNMELFNFLMAKKVNINKCCRGLDRYSPLMLAVMEKSTEMVQRLLQQDDIQKNFVNSVQKGALCCAVENEDDEMVDILTRNGVLATPATLQRAESLGNAFILEKVLNTRGIEFFLPRQQHDAIYQAVIKGRLSALSVYLEKGFSLNFLSQFESPVEENPLFHAVLRNAVEMVRLLVKNKVDVSFKIGGRTPLELARIMDYQEVAEILQSEHKRRKLSVHKKGSCKDDEESPLQTLLTLTLSNEILLPAIKKLITKGFDINAYEACGFTSLHSSIFKDNVELVKFLIQNGADPNRQSKEPCYLTPLQAAVIRGSLPIVKLLLTENVKMEISRPVLVLYGTDTYYTDWIVNPKHMPRHRSALCDAVCRSHVNIAILLLHCGFNLAEEEADNVRWMMKHTKSNHVRKLMTDHVRVPRKLSIMCRDSIRRQYRHNIQKVVAEQDIPRTLKNMLLLQDLISQNIT